MDRWTLRSLACIYHVVLLDTEQCWCCALYWSR